MTMFVELLNKILNIAQILLEEIGLGSFLSYFES